MPAFGVLVWYILAASAIVAALLVVHMRDLFKAALFLVATFITVIGFFVLLRAEFLAVVQLLIYVGAISVLIIFAVMLTRDVGQGSPFNRFQVPALTIAGLLLAGIVFAVTDASWNLLPDLASAPDIHGVFTDTPARLGQLLVTDYALAVEIAAVLLVSAIIGAIVLVKER